MNRLDLLRTSAVFWKRLGIPLALILAVSGCGDGKVWVYVDNGSDKPMAVSVDGKQEATVAPGKFEVVKCEPGKRRFEIKCGSECIFNGTQEFKKSDACYLFNPDQRNRYRTYTVEYGSNPFREWLKLQKEKPVDSGNELKAAYDKLAAEPKLLPAEMWIEVVGVNHVLKREEEAVMTRRGKTAKRTVLARVNPKDYALIEAARVNSNPSESDFMELFDTVERVLDSKPKD